MANPNHELGLTSTEMLARAKRSEPDLKPRMLELFRNQALLPPMTRAGYHGRGAIYRYPIGAERQLDDLLAWRKIERNVDWLRVLLWVDRWPVPLDRVRPSLARALRAAVDTVDAELQKYAQAGAADPISAMAVDLAKRRGANTVMQRQRGVTAHERQQALDQLLHAVLDPTAQPPVEDQRAAERAIGINPNTARRHGVPAFTINYEDWPLFGPPGTLDLRGFLTLVEHASDEQLDRAGYIANLFVVLLPIAAKLLTAITGGATGSPFDPLKHTHDQPIEYAFAVGLALSFDHHDLLGDLPQLAAALSELFEQIESINTVLDMPQDQVRENVNNDRKILDRLAYIATSLDLDAIEAVQDRQGPRTQS
jgi:hypothetical protein